MDGQDEFVGWNGGGGGWAGLLFEINRRRVRRGHAVKTKRKINRGEIKITYLNGKFWPTRRPTDNGHRRKTEKKKKRMCVRARA